MTPDQIPELINQISYADNRILPTDPAEAIGMAALWAVVLTDVPYEYAVQAVGEHYAKSPFTIRPADIAARWAATVHDRLQRHTDPTPVADPDDEAAYRHELRSSRHAVAQGHTEPAPHQLASGPAPAIAALTTGIGRDVSQTYIPTHIRDELAAALPAWGERHAAQQRGEVDLLATKCTWCKAEPGQECRRRTHGKGRAGWHRRTEPHPSRIDDVVIATAGCPDCKAAAGQPCCQPDGTFLSGLHEARRVAVLGAVVVPGSSGGGGRA